MRRAAAYHKECILMELILACIFIAPPPVLTVLNVRSLFAKKAFFPRVLLIVTVVYGFFCYWVFLGYADVTTVPWDAPVYEDDLHQIISSEYFLSFIVPCAAGFAGLFIIAFFQAEKLPPLVAVFALAGVCIGNAENIVFALQVSKKFWGFSPSAGLVGFLFGDFENMLPHLFHVNLLLLSVFHIRRQIRGQLALIEAHRAEAAYTWQKKLYGFLSRASKWYAAAFVAVLPLALVIDIVLILFGQGADGPAKAFTMTADWTFSEQVPPPPLAYEGHYLCTVAAGGHCTLVKPLRFGIRGGQKIVVNRQLAVANAFEELVQERFFRLHRTLRHFYDTHGYPVSRLITTKLRADIVYILMKPAEWFFVCALYLLCTDPEQRIRRQYAEE